MDDVDRVLDHRETLPLEIVANTFDRVIEAARVKATHLLSYVDAFAVAAAARVDAAMVTGDREFEAVEALVSVAWIGGRTRSMDERYPKAGSITRRTRVGVRGYRADPFQNALRVRCPRPGGEQVTLDFPRAGGPSQPGT